VGEVVEPVVVELVAEATEIVTVEPLATLAPASGFWATTVPARWSELTGFFDVWSPRASRVAWASGNGLPVRSGTATWPAVVAV
jgi:hypothetical protein